MRTEVLIVGAGPAGLALAAALASDGHEVLVLDENTEPIQESRASTLHARSVELLDQHGVLARLAPLGRTSEGHYGGLPVDLSVVQTPYAGIWHCPQPMLVNALLEHALEAGARVLRGRTVRTVLEGADGASVGAMSAGGPQQVHARWVIGADGTKSLIAGAVGGGWVGRAGRRRLLRADITGIQIAQRRFELHTHGLAIARTFPTGITRVMTHRDGGSGDHPATTDEVINTWHAVVGEDLSQAEFVWVDAFDDVARRRETARRGPLLLVGDALHQQMPAGGQGINLALYDAYTLAAALGGVQQGESILGAAKTLDTWASARLAHADRMLAHIATQAELLMGTDRESLRQAVGDLLTEPAAAVRLATVLAGYDNGDHASSRTARSATSASTTAIRPT